MVMQEGPQNRHVLICDSSADTKDRFAGIISKCGESTTISTVETVETSTEALARLKEASRRSNHFSVLVFHTSNKPELATVKELAHIITESPDLQLILIVDKVCNEWSELFAQLGNKDQFIVLSSLAKDIEVIQAVEVMTSKWSVAHNLNEMVKASLEELERTTMQLSIKQGQLLQSQKLESMGQLAAGIAHEINTPIQYVGDNVRFLEKSFEDLQQVIDAYEALRRAAINGEVTETLLEMTKQALEDADYEFLVEEIPQAAHEAFSGVDAVKKIVLAMKAFSHPGGQEKQLVNINENIENVLTICRNLWKYSAEIDLDLDKELPPVPVLLGEFNQVLLNIVVNGIHAIEATSREGLGTLKISSRSVGDEVIICVSDNGIGIPKEILSRIFDPFFTTKEVGIGTGQGLHISRSVIVEKHNGRIDVETEEGVGSKFTIVLPNKRQVE